MEGTEMENRDVALRCRCVRAAILLYSLKSSPNRCFMSSNNDRDEEKDQMLEEIRVLRMKLARERIKSKRINLRGLMEVILQVILVLSFFTVGLMLLSGPHQIDDYY